MEALTRGRHSGSSFGAGLATHDMCLASLERQLMLLSVSKSRRVSDGLQLETRPALRAVSIGSQGR
jgi:hypothetical protein